MPCSLTNTADPRSQGHRTAGAAILAIAVPLLCVAHAAYAQATPPGPMKWNYGYDAVGNVKTTTDPNGGVTEYTYDNLNRLRTITWPAPGPGLPRPQMLLGYDGGSRNLSRVQDPRGLVTLYDIDGLGRVLSVQSPDSGLTTFTYDGGNEPITRTDARGITHTYTYDDGNRLARIDYPTGTPTVYEYGQVGGTPRLIGELILVTDESGSTSYDYTGFGEVKSKTQVVNSAAGSRSFTVTTDWGEQGIVTGKPVRITYPSGTSVEIGYEYAGRPGSITVTRNGQASILLSGVTYNALHALKDWTWGDGTPYQRTFDNFARLSTYPLGNPAGTGAAMGLTRTLSYDNTANITGYLHTGQPGFDQTHRYDGLDRLIETLKTSTRYGYQYDATSNRRVREIGSDSYLHTVEDGSNRLASVQEPSSNGGIRACTYQYGSSGNLTGDGINTFTYSDRGRMSRVDTPNGSVSYLINGLEQRVSKTGLTVPTGAAYYVYDDKEGKLLGEYNADGTPLYEVIYLRGTPVGVVTPTGLYYVYADHIDTPRVIARNADHAIVWRWDEAEAFGATPPNEDPNGFGIFTFNMRFPGQVYDREAGLFYNVNRDYRPSDGRYVQADPIGQAGGINLYTYVRGNPLSLVDPDGLCPCGDVVDLIQLARGDKRDWSQAADRTDVNKAFGEGTYKCNLFADEQYETAGYNLPNVGGMPWSKGKYPPGAGQVSDPGFNLPGWPRVSGPAQAGDLVGFRGHVGIATGANRTISAAPWGKVEGDWGFRPGQEAAVIRRCSCGG